MSGNNLLDPLDLKILDVLQEDARMDIAQIARRLHRSASTITDRIHRLTEAGFIDRFVAVLDRNLVGRPILMITLVMLDKHTAKTLKAFHDRMLELPEVQVCLHLSGKFDFLVQTTLREPEEYKVFLDSKLCNLPMVKKIQSSLVLKECKMGTALPLDHGA